MAKNQKPPPKSPEPSEDSAPAAPPGASFDTEAGREAHGMRKDLGGDPAKPPKDAEEHRDKDEEDETRER